MDKNCFKTLSFFVQKEKAQAANPSKAALNPGKGAYGDTTLSNVLLFLLWAESSIETASVCFLVSK